MPHFPNGEQSVSEVQGSHCVVWPNYKKNGQYSTNWERRISTVSVI